MPRPQFRPSADSFCEFCGRRIRWAGDDHRYGIRPEHRAQKRRYPRSAASPRAKPPPELAAPTPGHLGPLAGSASRPGPLGILYGLGRRLASVVEPVRAQRPTRIFLSYQHNTRDRFITDQIRASYSADTEAQLAGVRLVDDPEPGRLIPSSIMDKIERSDGVLGLWTSEAKNSFWVNFEMYVADRFSKPICLIRHESQRLPAWYGNLRLAIDLRGIAFKSVNVVPWTDRKRTSPHEFDDLFLRDCRIFATRVRTSKADSGFWIPSPFGHNLRHEPTVEEWARIEPDLELRVRMWLDRGAKPPAQPSP